MPFLTNNVMIAKFKDGTEGGEYYPSLFGHNNQEISMNRLCTIVGLLVLVFLSASVTFAQDVKRQPTIIPMVKHGESLLPLREIAPAPRRAPVRRVINNPMIPRPPLDPAAFKGKEEDEDGLVPAEQGVQNFYGAAALPSFSKSFEGVGEGLAGYSVCCVPPDTNGEVGPNHYVQTVNIDLAVFNKTTGAVITGPVPTNTLWTGFGGDCEFDNDGDPTVNYDQIADRWVIAQFAVEQGFTPFHYLECVAVSKTADPSGAYWLYAFDFGSTDFNDYPKLAVWPDAYYATYNVFGNAFTGRACAMDRTNMLAGNAATQVCFDDQGDGGLLASDLEGTTLPPAGSPNFVMQLSYDDFDGLTAKRSGLKLWKFHADFAGASFTWTGPFAVATQTVGEACATKSRGACVKEPGQTIRLESLADRLMNRLTYRNFGTYESVLINHAVRLGNKPGSAKVAQHWIEMRSPNATPTIFQEATYAPTKSSRWMGSIAQDKLGDMAMGFSISNKKLKIFPEPMITGRLVADPINQMSQGESVLQTATASQTTYGRWGDYSGMTVDPADDCTFWFTTEYLTNTGVFNWHTRIGAFKFPSCN